MNRDALDPPRIKWLVEPTYDDDGVQRSAGLDNFGREHGDPVPTAPPFGVSVIQTDTLHDSLRRLLVTERAKFQALVEAEQFETEAEANDFLVPDELFPPGNEAWEDIFEFPAPGEGRSPTLAGEAPNGENRAPEDATRQPSGIVSAGSASPSTSSATMVGTQTGVSGSATDTGDASQQRRG